jgi:hypothetical protein
MSGSHFQLQLSSNISSKALKTLIEIQYQYTFKSILFLKPCRNKLNFLHLGIVYNEYSTLHQKVSSLPCVKIINILLQGFCPCNFLFSRILLYCLIVITTPPKSNNLGLMRYVLNQFPNFELNSSNPCNHMLIWY